MKLRAVHQRGIKGKPACGYHRWSSQTFTTTDNPEKVTCRRKGCVTLKPQESLAEVDRGGSTFVTLPAEVEIETWPSLAGSGVRGGWVSKVTIRTKNVETGHDTYIGCEWPRATKPTPAELAAQVTAVLAHKVAEQLGLNPHAVKAPDVQDGRPTGQATAVPPPRRRPHARPVEQPREEPPAAPGV